MLTLFKVDRQVLEDVEQLGAVAPRLRLAGCVLEEGLQDLGNQGARQSFHVDHGVNAVDDGRHYIVMVAQSIHVEGAEELQLALVEQILRQGDQHGGQQVGSSHPLLRVR